MEANASGFKLAPPTSAPSISSCAINPLILSGLTLPPYRIRNPEACFREHRGRHLPGEGAFRFPAYILRGNRNCSPPNGLGRCRQRRKRRRDDDVAMSRAGYKRHERGKVGARLCLRLVHFPVSGNYRSSHRGSFIAIVAMSQISTSSTHGAQRSTENDREIAVLLA